MGSCLGRCLRRSNSNPKVKHNHYNRSSLLQDDSIEFFTLMETEENKPNEARVSTSFISRIFSKMDKHKKKSKRKPVLELAEDLWNPLGDASYCRLNESSSENRLPLTNSGGDISLQCLDARALLTRNASGRDRSTTISTSTPPSSLDLEWEHEGLPSPAPWQILPEEDDFLPIESSSQNSQPVLQNPRCSSEITNLSGWSRISTPDSLEWDPVQISLQDIAASDLAISDLDAETEQLLSEIERLTRRALRETGRELNR